VLADFLRARIITGELKPGEKLPIEPDLSTQHGVSRSTVREALRVLASQNLITTTRGVCGGSFVAYPNPEQISAYLEASIRLLAQADNLSIPELAEMWSLLEVPAAGLAAMRRSPDQLQDLKKTLFSRDEVTPGRALELAKDFHSALMRASGSALVEVMARPVFEVLHDHMVTFEAPSSFWASLEHDHERIFQAIEDQDAATAQQAAREHLQKLQPALS